MNNKHAVANQLQQHELGEIKKDSCKAYMVTYKLNDWVKAGSHIGERSVFRTDQIVPSVLASSN